MAEERKSPQAPPDPRAAHPFLGRQSKCVDGKESLDPVFRGSHPQLPSPRLPTSLPPLHKWKQNKNKNVAFTLFLQCLSGDGGRVPTELCKLQGCSGLIRGRGWV